MKILDFYGNKLSVEDISSIVTRKAKLSSSVDLVGSIIGSLFLILTTIVFFMTYKYHKLSGQEAFFSWFFAISIASGIQVLREKFFNKIYIVEIKMNSGESYKSNKMTEIEAIKKKNKISDEIEKF